MCEQKRRKRSILIATGRKKITTGPVKNYFHVHYQAKGHGLSVKISTHCACRCLLKTIQKLHEGQKYVYMNPGHSFQSGLGDSAGADLTAPCLLVRTLVGI